MLSQLKKVLHGWTATFGRSVSKFSAVLAGFLVVAGTAYAATTLWSPGSAPQTGPTGGNVKPPVTAAAMIKDRFCTATGSGNEIKCENTAAEITTAAGIDGTNGANGTNGQNGDSYQSNLVRSMGLDPKLWPESIVCTDTTGTGGAYTWYTRMHLDVYNSGDTGVGGNFKNGVRYTLVGALNGAYVIFDANTRLVLDGANDGVHNYEVCKKGVSMDSLIAGGRTSCSTTGCR